MSSQAEAFWAKPSARSPSVRGERTRRRIAEATLSLLEESETPPTSRDIAERAGVSLRLIFHHFADLDALHEIVGSLYKDRFGQFAFDVPDHLPLATRIDRTVKMRAKLFESTRNLGRNVMVLAPQNPGLRRRLVATQEMMVRALESSFAPELREAGARRKELLAAVDAATCWTTWDRMRTVNNLSVVTSRRVMSEMLSSALVHPGDGRSRASQPATPSAPLHGNGTNGHHANGANGNGTNGHHANGANGNGTNGHRPFAAVGPVFDSN